MTDIATDAAAADTSADTSAVVPESAQITPGLKTRLGEAQDTENYIEAYQASAEWIRFADAKAAVVLTVSGALAGLLIPTIKTVLTDTDAHLIPHWETAVLTLFCLFILFLLLAGVAAFLCINPFRSKGLHPALDHCKHFHPAAIAHHYKIEQLDEFIDKCVDGGSAQFRREVIAGMLFDAHISTHKYTRVSQSIKLFALAAGFAFLYLLGIQL